MGVLSTVFVVGWTVIALNRSLTKVVPTNLMATVSGDSAERLPGPDGVNYRVARPHGVEGVPNGAYLTDEAGRIRYKVEEGIGSKDIAAPQARLMSLVIDGILTHQLLWGLVLLGVFISILMEIVGVPALAFAVGVYLPLESTVPVFAGGFVRSLVDRKRGGDAESDAGPGVLFSSGLIAGGSLMGLGFALLSAPQFDDLRASVALGRFLPTWITQGSLVGLLTFVGVCTLLYWAARSGPAVAPHGERPEHG